MQIEDKIYAVIPLEGETLSYVRIKFDNILRRRALIDSGSCSNAIPLSLLNEFEEKQICIEVETPTYNTVKLASSAPVVVKQQIKVKFTIGYYHFSDSFLVLPTMNTVILGNPFFKKNFIDISPAYKLLKLPEMTIQLNELKPCIDALL